jgi:hypothetical protein
MSMNQSSALRKNATLDVFMRRRMEALLLLTKSCILEITYLFEDGNFDK